MTGMLRAGDLLSPDSLARLDALGPAEVVVSVPALNHGRSILQVLDALATGLHKHLAHRKSVLLVIDAGSQDDTEAKVRAWLPTVPTPPAVQWLQLASAAARGRALLAALAAALRLTARACAFVDADLISAAPEWIPGLLQPILEGEVACVLPVYTRALSEGTLTTNLLAPLTRALYGKRIREVTGGCAGLAPALATPLLDPERWRWDRTAAGVDLLLTTEVIASGAAVTEALLGPKQVAATSGQPDLATTLVQTVGALFSAMERHYERWDAVQGSVPVSHVDGTLLEMAADVHVERMVRAFRIGLKDLLPVWEQIMPEETLAQLYPLGMLPAEEFRFPLAAWARSISDFAVAFQDQRLPRDHLLRALAPLYLGRVAAFLLEARDVSPAQIADLLESIGRAFEYEKENLRFRWR